MIKISISDDFGKNVVLHFDSTSIRMISRFLHFISFSDHTLYRDYSDLQCAVADFYDSNYNSIMIQDAKALKSVLDYVTNNLS